jgi:hypothetical protein
MSARGKKQASSRFVWRIYVQWARERKRQARATSKIKGRPRHALFRSFPILAWIRGIVPVLLPPRWRLVGLKCAHKRKFFYSAITDVLKEMSVCLSLRGGSDT